MFLEFDNFSTQTLTNTYVNKQLPTNSLKLINSGICNSRQNNLMKLFQYYGYNLMEETDLGNGELFLYKLLHEKYDKEFKINNEDMRYRAVACFLLQVVLIIGHLQTSLNFYHGDYKLENIFVKRSNPQKVKTFKFNVFGKDIFVKNMGFAVVIANFNKSSININSVITDKKYRLIPPVVLHPILSSYLNDLVKRYNNKDPELFGRDSSNNSDSSINDKLMKKYYDAILSPKVGDTTINNINTTGFKLYKDFDLYTFFTDLLNNETVREYIVEYIVSKRLDETVMSFMSPAFRDKLLKMESKQRSSNNIMQNITSILHKINEPMSIVFTKNYIEILDLLNYKLFVKIHKMKIYI